MIEFDAASLSARHTLLQRGRSFVHTGLSWRMNGSRE